MNNKFEETHARRIALLISHLADGQFHSGESLGEVLGVSRAAVWKSIHLLQDVGIEVERVRGKGYRIEGGLSLLDEGDILQAMDESAQAFYKRFYLFDEIGSTNTFLLELSDSGTAEYSSVCLAERQLTGRGRRGRTWISPFGRNIYCSVLWRFNKPLAALEGLSLVVGLSIQKALTELGYEDIMLKWPNDILHASNKLAGILLEVRGDLMDFCDVVIGFGVNVHMPANAGGVIDQAWTDLSRLSPWPVNRNHLVATILNHLGEDLQVFEQSGFAVFKERWNRRDALYEKHVDLHFGQGKVVQGLAMGVDAHGALLLQQNGDLNAFHGGEISVRKAAEH